jgi:cytochrome c-type biogenesis protein CcmH/NrfG
MTQGRYAEALEAYQKALAIRERIGDQQGIATATTTSATSTLTKGGMPKP